MARTALALGRRAISLETSPLSRLLADVVVRAPDLRHLDAAFQAVAAAPLGTSSLRAWIDERFATACPTCGRTLALEELVWEPADGRAGRSRARRISSGVVAATAGLGASAAAPATAGPAARTAGALRPTRRSFRCPACLDRRGRGGELRHAAAGGGRPRPGDGAGRRSGGARGDRPPLPASGRARRPARAAARPALTSPARRPPGDPRPDRGRAAGVPGDLRPPPRPDPRHPPVEPPHRVPRPGQRAPHRRRPSPPVGGARMARTQPVARLRGGLPAGAGLRAGARRRPVRGRAGPPHRAPRGPARRPADDRPADRRGRCPGAARCRGRGADGRPARAGPPRPVAAAPRVDSGPARRGLRRHRLGARQRGGAPRAPCVAAGPRGPAPEPRGCVASRPPRGGPGDGAGRQGRAAPGRRRGTRPGGHEPGGSDGRLARGGRPAGRARPSAGRPRGDGSSRRPPGRGAPDPGQPHPGPGSGRGRRSGDCHDARRLRRSGPDRRALLSV